MILHHAGKATISLVFALGILTSAEQIARASSAGISGRTLKPGSTPGCTCHGSQNTNTTFSVSGPTAVAIGGTYSYSVTLNGSSGSNGGIDIAVFHGTLALNASSVSMRVLNGEVVQSQAVSVPSVFQFNYTAPAAAGTDTMYITGKGGASNNSWNHAAKVVIQVLALPVVPVLLSPSNGASGVSTRPTLAWNASSGASTYRLQVSVSNTFGTTLFDDSTITLTTRQLSNPLNNGSAYFWRVRGMNAAGVSDWSQTWSFTTSLTGVTQGKDLPLEFALRQNFPNPFNPTTIISYELPPPSGAEGSVVSTVRLVVYDLLGREVAVLVDERKAPGRYSVEFNASGLASGVYFAHLRGSDATGLMVYSAVRKLLLER